MLTLNGKALAWGGSAERTLWKLTSNQALPVVLREKMAFLQRGNGPLPQGFGAYILPPEQQGIPPCAHWLHLPPDFAYLAEGDIISVNAGRIRTLWRQNSPHNAVLLTERCDNNCVMCSQPPKNIQDDWLVAEAMDLVRMIPPSAPVLGFTGGEPALLGQRLIDLLALTRARLPTTAVHLLSNGRGFADPAFSDAYAAIQHPDLMVGIPLYAADPAQHDYIVQARGAFDQTVRGILALKERGQRVEVRVVLHRQTIDGLPTLAQFIARNLQFIDQVALMGLEVTGFARANLDQVWIDPADYRPTLENAVALLRDYQVPVRIYNHPLCLLGEMAAQYSVKSISDWKNEYVAECAACTRRQDCGGFFSSGARYRYSPSLRPFL
ncbi:His-Xaa-Ser system radical SAM maturase HxsC [Insolitispirillum peregrinum]|uniref:His-Xaa-Ser system radical SAM maturase HxsC n=1 Tax=Insolitispirillum peregrinum TaxID=80876 RepID=UPI003620B2D2